MQQQQLLFYYIYVHYFLQDLKFLILADMQAMVLLYSVFH